MKINIKNDLELVPRTVKLRP